MRIFRLVFLWVLFIFLLGCSSSANPVSNGIDQQTGNAQSGGRHIQAAFSMSVDPSTGSIALVPSRSASNHLDLVNFWKYNPDMLVVKLVAYDPVGCHLEAAISFMNPTDSVLGDVRAIWKTGGGFVPETIDGLTLRGGGTIDNPNVYFGFGNDLPKRRFNKGDGDTRWIVFSFKSVSDLKNISFILDATVNGNTSEPYAFGSPMLTGRFFHIQISDWQNDITGAWLDITPAGWPYRLKMAAFGSVEWGTSIPDIQPGDYTLMLTAQSPESPGEENAGQPVTLPGENTLAAVGPDRAASAGRGNLLL